MAHHRRPLIAGNWKMHGTLAGSRALASEVIAKTLGFTAEIVIIPPAPFVAALSGLTTGSHVALGAQNLHPAAEGAFTGESSGGMWKDLGVRYVLCGHSERRHLFHEAPEWIGDKVAAAVRSGLCPILCVGETLDERRRGVTEAVVTAQLAAGLAPLGGEARADGLVIAYEPVWAIGTGETATPAQAQAVHATIRAWLGDKVNTSFSESVRILYGGSVKANNAAELLAEPDLDGALVGGASLDASAFAAIAAKAEQAG